MNAPRVRPIDARSERERQWVAERMRDTLIEVLGAERGASMFSRQWLLDRVEQHLDGRLDGAVFVVCAEGDAIVGHSIVRRERDERHGLHGYISTSYVAPTHRRRGLARALVRADEQWFRERSLERFVTHTHPDNGGLRALFRSLGYRELIVARGDPPEPFAELVRRADEG